MEAQLITDEHSFVLLPEKPVVSVFKIVKAFDTIYLGLNKERLAVIELEFAKIMPSDESEVLLSVDFDQQEQSVGISLYVSNPKPYCKDEKVTFSELMFECLLRTDLENLHHLNNCLQHLNPAKEESFTIDGIPVFDANEDDDDDEITAISETELQAKNETSDNLELYIHFRITKEA